MARQHALLVRERRVCRPRTTSATCSSCRRRADHFLGNPTQKTYDVNLSGGGALVQNRLWVNGTIRRWVVNKLTNAKNARRHAGARRQHAEELLGQGGRVDHGNQQAVGVVPLERQDSRPSPRHAARQRARHRRAGPDQPGADDAGEVHRHPQPSGLRVVFSVMDGQTNYGYQPGTPADAIRVRDGTLSTADFAARRATKSSPIRATSSTTSFPTR